MQLSHMQVGSRGRITKLGLSDRHYRNRLIAMGLIPGTEFILSRIAPLGDPVEILIKGSSLILRKAEAAILQIEQIEKVPA